MLPQAEQARKAIWEAINPHTGKRRIDEAFPKELRSSTRENDMMIKFINGSTWQVVGSDNYNSLVGSPPIGVVFSEWALADPEAWAYISPILDENGGWALFITTPRGRNHAHSFLEMARRSPDWFHEVSTARDTGVFSQEMQDKTRNEYIDFYGDDEGDAKFRQEYLCSFDAAISGSYYGKLMSDADGEKRVCGVPYNPSCPVFTAWDLGFGDSTAIWFAQAVGKEMRIIDYYEASGVGLDHYVKHVKAKPYNYEKHILPHDAEQGQLQTGTTLATQIRGMGLNNLIILPKGDVDAGIQAVRQLIPQCWFDENKCKRGLETLRNYARKWDDKNKVYAPRPLHDWCSHGADAFRYLAQGLPMVNSPAQRKEDPFRVNSGSGLS